MDKNKDKRRHPRVTAVNLVSVQQVSQEQLQEYGYLGSTVNLSKGGVLFESKHPFPLLATVKLSMTLKDKVVNVSGRVVRLEEIAENRIAVAVHFTEVSDEDRQTIIDYLAEKQEGKEEGQN